MYPYHPLYVSEEDCFSPFPPFLENLLNKKVNGLALTYFEKMMDVSACCFSVDYNKRFNFKVIQSQLNHHFRVHYFQDLIPLFDLTKDKIAGVICKTYASGQTKEVVEFITLNHCLVKLGQSPEYHYQFSRQFNTSYFVVQNTSDAHIIEIREYQEAQIEAIWQVDLNQLHCMKVHENGQEIAKEKVYYASCLPLSSFFPHKCLLTLLFFGLFAFQLGSPLKGK